MDLEIRHLRLIDAIAKQGSMTKAALHLDLTQSALSHQLREIEERLGTPLFLRLKKKLLLTEAGERLLASSRMVLNELERTEETIRRMAAGQEGVLRISTQCNTAYYWLPGMLRIFQQQYPKVDIEIVVEATSRPIEALLEGKLDLAIVFKPVLEKDLILYPLFTDEMLVVMCPDHPLASRRFVKPQDFFEESVILYSATREDSILFQKLLNPSGVAPRNIIRVQLTEAIVEMVRAGIGLSVLAKWAVAPYLKSGDLVGVPLSPKGYHREWMAAMVKSEHHPPYLFDFARLVAHNAMPLLDMEESILRPRILKEARSR